MIVGRKKVKSSRSKICKENKSLKEEVHRLKKQLWKLQKRETRRKKAIQSPQLTPKKKLGRILSGKFTQPTVRKELFKGLVVQEELKAKVQKLGNNVKEKTCFGRLFTGKVLKVQTSEPMSKHYTQLLPARQEVDS